MIVLFAKVQARIQEEILNVLIVEAVEVKNAMLVKEQVIYGNLVQVQLTDWYDDFISKFGREHGLDRYFNLCPVEGYDSIYVSLATPKIVGNRKQFMKALLEEVNGRCGFGYHYDTKLDTIQKGFHE